VVKYAPFDVWTGFIRRFLCRVRRLSPRLRMLRVAISKWAGASVPALRRTKDQHWEVLVPARRAGSIFAFSRGRLQAIPHTTEGLSRGRPETSSGPYGWDCVYFSPRVGSGACRRAAARRVWGARRRVLLWFNAEKLSTASPCFNPRSPFTESYAFQRILYRYLPQLL
jgi:hypothetical protein